MEYILLYSEHLLHTSDIFVLSLGDGTIYNDNLKTLQLPCSTNPSGLARAIYSAVVALSIMYDWKGTFTNFNVE